MRRNSMSLAEMGRRLGVTRQAVSKAVKGTDKRVSQTLESTAAAAKIEVRYLDPEKDVLLGYSHETKDRVIVTFSTQYAIHIWHYCSGRCKGCETLVS